MMAEGGATGIWGNVLGAMKVLYQLALGLGGPGLFLLALADSSFLSIPEGNDLLIVVLSTGQSWGRMTYLVVMTTLGSVAGCTLLYLVGRRGGRFAERRLSLVRAERMARLYQRWGVLSIIVPSVLPPRSQVKVFVLSAGMFGLSFPRFLFAVAFGRSLRYFTWGILAVLFGGKAKELLETHFKTIGIVLFVLLILIIGGIAVHWMRVRRRER